MVKKIFQPEWRTQSKAKRRFYARYMGWLERTGFLVVVLLLAAFAYSFVATSDEWITAEDVPIEAGIESVLSAPDTVYVETRVPEGRTVRAGEVVAVVFVGTDAEAAAATDILDRIGRRVEGG